MEAMYPVAHRTVHENAKNIKSKRRMEAAMYVVIGATGNTGNVVAKHLLARGEKVRAIGRTADRLQPLAKLGAEPFVANITDTGALARAFAGAQAVYVMLPPDVRSEDVLAQSKHVSDALASAIEKTGIKHVVVLSSFGADKTERTGFVATLTHLEQKLRQIAGLNLLCLRSGYFMENTLAQIGMLHAMGKTAGPLRGDLKLPMIATRDVGAFAADAVLKANFSGKQTHEVLGQRDLDMNEATALIGKAIGKPDLQYVQLPPDQVRPGLMQMGMSENIADLLLEMSDSLNSGHIRALEKRSPENTTPTSFETFVADTFMPLYKGKSQAA
jgi:uncharacterized protein YbjT (DUF2867 family)